MKFLCLKSRRQVFKWASHMGVLYEMTLKKDYPLGKFEPKMG